MLLQCALLQMPAETLVCTLHLNAIWLPGANHAAKCLFRSLTCGVHGLACVLQHGLADTLGGAHG